MCRPWEELGWSRGVYSWLFLPAGEDREQGRDRLGTATTAW